MEHDRDLEEFLVRSARQIDLPITREQTAQFMCYLSQLLRWNKTINLTSITDPQEIVIKHFIDSLVVLTFTDFSVGAVVADLGTGGGFPGLPLKIMRKDLRLELIEPSKKKCSFLTSLVGLLQLHDVNAFPGTITQYSESSNKRPPIDIILLRALKFETIKDKAIKLLPPRSRMVLYRTEPLDINHVPREFQLASERSYSLPHAGGDRVISVLSRKET